MDMTLIRDPIRYLEDNYSDDTCEKFMEMSVESNDLNLFKYCLSRMGLTKKTMSIIIKCDRIDHLEYLYNNNLLTTCPLRARLRIAFSADYGSVKCLKYYIDNYANDLKSALDIIVYHKMPICTMILLLQFSMDHKIPINLDNFIKNNFNVSTRTSRQN